MSASQLVLDILDTLRPSKGNWWRGSCPFCALEGHVDKKHSFGLQIMSGVYNCFRCGATGHIDVPDDLVHHAPRTETPDLEAQRPPDGFVPIVSEDGLTAECLRPARKYLKSRGITRTLAKEAAIGAVAVGRYHSRVIVPVLGEEGVWLGWVGRTWADGGELPYIYPGGEWRGQVLYNARSLRVETEKPVIVVEGVFDSLALWPDSVALLGKPSDPQVEALIAARRPVVVVLDGDAWNEGRWLATRLRFRGQRAGYVRLPPGVDPDEVDRLELEAQALASLA